MPLLKAIFVILAQFDIQIMPDWLASKSNVLADCLSRGDLWKTFGYGSQTYRAALKEWRRNPRTYLRPRDFDDWKVHEAVFADWDRQFGPFEVDGCADAFGANSQLEESWSDFEAQDCAGRRIYANPPFSNIESILKHFLLAKKRSPSGTAGLFVLPFC